MTTEAKVAAGMDATTPLVALVRSVAPRDSSRMHASTPVYSRVGQGLSLSGADKDEAKQAITKSLSELYAHLASSFYVCTDTYGGLYTACARGSSRLS